MQKSEALTKWCPFARVAAAGYGRKGEPLVVAINRTVQDGEDLERSFPLIPPPVLCIADQCMAWRPSAPVAVREDGKECGFCGLTGP